MFRFSSPDSETVERFLADQRNRPLTYGHQGKTATTPPSGFNLDHTRVCLGQGIEIFDKAKMGLQGWQQFELGWVSARPVSTPIGEGEQICIVGQAVGLYWLNACRIVYVIDDSTSHPKFGYAYGTLPAHMEMGEERFLVEMDSQGDVWYDILAFSRPNRWLTRLANYYMRTLQKRFGRESAAHMKAIAQGKIPSSF
ncbi:DUF1990 domain-containing protein [Bremerella cremea]|uniref:DUF1990 domain-containing protein n=1 Tax=Bremerella cremea TaxID=1031537 RepID=A0A368KV07_9BACT|nr:DUF1990 domain-containing protein [Bremerella cremea]RCS52722.1 DUF1990 domain-containing protein [Bremerella cremea]